MALLSEIWLKNEETVFMKNYNVFSNKREDGYGGVSILVKKNLIAKPKIISDLEPLEVIEVSIMNIPTLLKFVSIYLPPEISPDIVDEKFQAFLDLYENRDNVIIGGDFNAHHPLWNGGTKNNRKGIVISDSINHSNFVDLNDGSHTFEKIYKGVIYKSAIDVTLCARNLSIIAKWKRFEEFVGSDHLPIVTYLTNSQFATKRKIQKVDPVAACKFISESGIELSHDIEDFNNRLININENLQRG